MPDMTWHHEVDPAWLEARSDVLTATEMVGLLPAISRYNKAKEKPEICMDFAKFYAEKYEKQDYDPNSFGPAARGHWMEPFAIEDYNKQLHTKDAGPYYHWDDCIIVRGPFGFSPDALNTEQEHKDPKLMCDEDGILWWQRGDGEVFSTGQPTMMLEVKSFGAKSHMEAMLTDPKDLKQRYQIAAAMEICPSIEVGTLVFYNPSAKHQMFTRRYTREDLEEERTTINQIMKLWVQTIEKIDGIEQERWAFHTEEDVFSHMMEKESSILEFR